MLQTVLSMENVRLSLERDKELLQNSLQPSWITPIPFQPWRILKWRAYGFRLLFPHSHGHFLGCEKWKCTNGPFSGYFDCQLLWWRHNFLHVLSFSNLEPKIWFSFNWTDWQILHFWLTYMPPEQTLHFNCEEMDIWCLCQYCWTVYRSTVIDLSRAIYISDFIRDSLKPMSFLPLALSASRSEKDSLSYLNSKKIDEKWTWKGRVSVGDWELLPRFSLLSPSKNNTYDTLWLGGDDQGIRYTKEDFSSSLQHWSGH